mmetsp:Transcript_46066/g.129620  ORF Transcript_46066/g.129620 Transcript_46066/m.129620 type:complete len:246 (+) Transcript_46066:409-1146(+)
MAREPSMGPQRASPSCSGASCSPKRASGYRSPSQSRARPCTSNPHRTEHRNLSDPRSRSSPMRQGGRRPRTTTCRARTACCSRCPPRRRRPRSTPNPRRRRSRPGSTAPCSRSRPCWQTCTCRRKGSCPASTSWRNRCPSQRRGRRNTRRRRRRGSARRPARRNTCCWRGLASTTLRKAPSRSNKLQAPLMAWRRPSLRPSPRHPCPSPSPRRGSQRRPRRPPAQGHPGATQRPTHRPRGARAPP